MASFEDDGFEQPSFGGPGFEAPGFASTYPEATSSLVQWVGWYVASYEAWQKIPACWARHRAMVAELTVAMEIHLGVDVDLGGELMSPTQARAQWHEYCGRMLERLAGTPGGRCAKDGHHHEPTSWDREESAERRRAARLGSDPDR